MLGSAVVKLGNLLLGYQGGFDTTTSRVTKNDVALGVDQGNTSLHFRCIQIPKEIGLSAYYKGF